MMNWEQKRKHTLKKVKCIVVKVGSAVLTNAQGIDADIIHNIVNQLAFLHSQPCKVVLVSSGAVAAGRATLCNHSTQNLDLTGLAAKQAAAAIGQSRLMQHYDQAFAKHGLTTAQVLLTRDDLRSRQRFLNARNTFAELLSWGVVPVVNENDTVSVHELKFGDNDCLSSLLVNLVEADLFINLTSAKGVLSKNPDQDPQAAIMPCIEHIHELDLNALCGGKTTVGSGGMYSKLLAARRVAQLGVPTLILPGRVPNIIPVSFANTEHKNRIGTWVCADEQSIARRKFWLAYQSEPSGSIIVDEGAAIALEKKGSSLLPGGIVRVEGGFQQGALVRIMAQHNDLQSIGVGLSNYSAAEIKRIMGLKRHEVAAILGNAHYPEVVHRDNLLLDAAV